MATKTLRTRLGESQSQWPWVTAALIAHTAWGIYPVLARYLQTVSQLPSFSLLVLGNLGPLLFLVLFFRHHLSWRIFQSRVLWAFALIVVVRSMTNMLAARYTLSIYVQLITQTTPFLVVLLSATLFRERIPRFTGWALALCTAGALLMMSGDMGQISQSSATRTDWLGILLAFGSSLSLAFYMLVVRRTNGEQGVSSEGVLVVQMIAIASVNLLVSLLIGEDWSRWLAIGPTDWLVFGLLVTGVFLVANLTQIVALRHLGAPTVSSTMAWRLVSALIFGGLLLGERLTSLWQGLGAAMVLATITWYLRAMNNEQ
ncbi:MAG: DMT family transporter [Chloroflexi bacterium]|nr:DMT family transporter [Chloroflexota bacterium]